MPVLFCKNQKPSQCLTIEVFIDTFSGQYFVICIIMEIRSEIPLEFQHHEMQSLYPSFLYNTI